MHHSDTPSPWITRFGPLAPAGAPVLDVAGGYGRHARWFAARGHPVTLIDRDSEALAHVRATLPGVRVVDADIESGPWPLPGETFGAVIVTNYLWRALTPLLLGSVAAGGVLIHETFAQGNETVGKPAREDFLLRHGELLAICAGMRIVAYEDGFLEEPPRYVQRIVAVRQVHSDPAARYAI